MIRPIHRRTLLQAGLALCASSLVPSARACEFFAGNLRIYLPYTRATDERDDHAVLCVIFDEVTGADRLIGITTPVAGAAEMGGPGAGPRVDFHIPAGRESVLTEAGTHVRLTRLSHPLGVGRTYPMNFEFEKAGLVKGAFDVSYERLADATRTRSHRA